MLEPTETLLNGESFIVNEIANKVKEWRDNWKRSGIISSFGQR